MQVYGTHGAQVQTVIRGIAQSTGGNRRALAVANQPQTGYAILAGRINDSGQVFRKFRMAKAEVGAGNIAHRFQLNQPGG